MFKVLQPLAVLLVSSIGFAGTASAATFVFSAEVDSVTAFGTSPGNPVVAPIGTAGTVTLEIDDSNPLLPILNPGPVSNIFTASVSVPGFLQGAATFVDDSLSSFFFTASYLQFVTYGDTSFDDTGSFPTTVPGGYHSFRIDYGTPLSAVPVTIGEVVSALAQPGAFGFFRHEIELIDAENGRDARVTTLVTFEEVPEVPLPAAGWLLLGGLALLRLLRRGG